MFESPLSAAVAASLAADPRSGIRLPQGRSGVGAAQHRGAREHQCDACAVDVGAGTWSAAVVDGVGDDAAVAAMVGDLAEDLAARAMKLTPAEAIVAVGSDWYRELVERSVDAAVVVAAGDRDLVTVAWVGDASAHVRVPQGYVRVITTPHTRAQWVLDLDEEPEPGDHHLLTRTLCSGDPEQVVFPSTAVHRLLLCSDGVDKVMDDAALGGALAVGGPSVAAASVVATAILTLAGPALGHADNATALVVDPRTML